VLGDGGHHHHHHDGATAAHGAPPAPVPAAIVASAVTYAPAVNYAPAAAAPPAPLLAGYPPEQPAYSTNEQSGRTISTYFFKIRGKSSAIFFPWKKRET
jgi:hypothetical protein